MKTIKYISITQLFRYSIIPLFILTAIVLCGNIHAQDSRSELSVYGGGGLSGLKYKLDAGSPGMRFGGLAGIGYTWHFNATWGITTGVELAFYGGKCTFDNNFGGSYQAESGTSSQPGNDFTFEYSFKGYDEKQNATYIQIPVMAQFQKGMFYAAGGAKLGFPVSACYEVSASSLATSGYFPAEGQTYNTLPDRGLGTYNSFSINDDLSSSVIVALALEAGAKWALSDKVNLYAGVYFDYGLNNIAKKSDVPMVEYSKEAAGKLIYHSATGLSDSMKPLAVGLKLRISYSL